MRLFYSAVISIAFFYQPARAQLTLLAPTLKAKSGQTTVLEIRARSRDTLTAMQFSFTWNPKILQYVGLSSLGLDGIDTINNFGRNNAAAGRLTFDWVEASTKGSVLKDSLLLFKIIVQATGKSGDTAHLDFSSSPTKIIAYNSQSAQIAVTVQEGVFSVDGSTPVVDLSAVSSAALFQNFPNPADRQTTIPFELTEPGAAVLSVSNLTGATLWEKKGDYASGKHAELVFLKDRFPSGVYIYTLQTTATRLTRKLIVAGD